MKIGVMQMNKRIAVGKCVTVLYSCQAQLEKKKGDKYNGMDPNYVFVWNRLDWNISFVSMVSLTQSS